MKIKKLCLFFVIFLAGCTPTLSVLNHNTYKKLNEAQLKKTQFYLIDDLTICRYIGSEEVISVTDGSVKMERGHKIQKIYFPAGTKCIFLFHPNGDNKQMAMSLEEKDDTYYLTFGPNPKFSNEYFLQAKKWNNGIGTITYGPNEFETETVPRIGLDIKKVKYTEATYRKATGRKVGN